MDEPRNLSVREAAKMAGVSASLVYQWCADGTLPHYRLGGSGRRGKILIEPTEIEQLLKDRKVTGGGSSEPLRHISTSRK